MEIRDSALVLKPARNGVVIWMGKMDFGGPNRKTSSIQSRNNLEFGSFAIFWQIFKGMAKESGLYHDIGKSPEAP